MALNSKSCLHSFCVYHRECVTVNNENNRLTVQPSHYLQDLYLSSALSQIFERLCNEVVTENEVASLQSIVVKLVTHFDDMQYVFDLVSLALDPFF